jgi:hypothetical protein
LVVNIDSYQNASCIVSGSVSESITVGIKAKVSEIADAIKIVIQPVIGWGKMTSGAIVAFVAIGVGAKVGVIIVAVYQGQIAPSVLKGTVTKSIAIKIYARIPQIADAI